MWKAVLTIVLVGIGFGFLTVMVFYSWLLIKAIVKIDVAEADFQKLNDEIN